jgi:colanic acid/amylovoran biosynthesis glycosyltransferase
MTGNQNVPTELILLPSLSARRGPRGGLELTRKYMTGAAQYALNWPGPVTSLVPLSSNQTTDMDHAEYFLGEAETGLEFRPENDHEMAQRLQSAAVVVALLSRAERETAYQCRRLGVPVVFVSEYSPRTERQIVASEVSNPVLRFRRNIWLWRTERMRRNELLPIAAGLQCSGTPTFDIYSGLCRDTLLFFDNRVREEAVIDDRALATKAAALRQGRPLRLVFGGRFVAMKGVLELPKVAAKLARAGVPFTFDVFGSGPLSGELESHIRNEGLEDRMALRGVLDFDTGWIPYLRENADIFVCCHVQGDPSSTYPEVMSCGVPIAGYNNEAFGGILRESGAGWGVPLFDAPALARQLARLHGAREEIVAAASRARSFASQHAFETTFVKRVRHFIRNSRLPENLKALESDSKLSA